MASERESMIDYVLPSRRASWPLMCTNVAECFFSCKVKDGAGWNVALSKTTPEGLEAIFEVRSRIVMYYNEI